MLQTHHLFRPKENIGTEKPHNLGKSNYTFELPTFCFMHFYKLSKCELLAEVIQLAYVQLLTL